MTMNVGEREDMVIRIAGDLTRPKILKREEIERKRRIEVSHKYRCNVFRIRIRAFDKR